MPERTSAWSVYHQFKTKDEQTVFVGVTSDKQWARFCEAFARPDLAADPGLQTNNDRIGEREWLLPELRALMSSLELDDIVARCERAELPFSPLARPEDLLHDEHLSAGGSLLDTLFPGGQRAGLPALPLSLDGQRWGKRLDPPEPGEHSHELLTRAGLEPGDIDELLRDGVSVQPRKSSN